MFLVRKAQRHKTANFTYLWFYIKSVDCHSWFAVHMILNFDPRKSFFWGFKKPLYFWFYPPGDEELSTFFLKIQKNAFFWAYFLKPKLILDLLCKVFRFFYSCSFFGVFNQITFLWLYVYIFVNKYCFLLE